MVWDSWRHDQTADPQNQATARHVRSFAAMMRHLHGKVDQVLGQQ